MSSPNEAADIKAVSSVFAKTARERRTADKQLLDAIRGLSTTIDNRSDEGTLQIKALEAKVDQVLAGFPEGDPSSHRRFHEALIRKAEARAKMWGDLRTKLIERGVWATLLLGASLMLTGSYVYLKGLLDK